MKNKEAAMKVAFLKNKINLKKLVKRNTTTQGKH